MIDIKHLIENQDLYTKELEIRNMNTDSVQKAADLYSSWKEKLQNLEEIRQSKNEFNQKVVSLQGDEKMQAIQEMKQVSEESKKLEEAVKELREELDKTVYQIPNLTYSEIPVGPDDSGNKVTQKFGDKPEFDFQPKNYFDLPVFKRDYLGEKGVEVFGSRGYYIRGKLMKLQRVLFNYVLDQLVLKGFEIVYPPIMVNEKALYGTGFFPTGKEDTYKVEAGDKEFYLVGTSEAPLMFLESGETLELNQPKLLTAWTTCFRKEAGSYGKDTQGGIRVHQFEKIETVCLCLPEESDKMFEFLTSTFTENMQSLGLHLQHLEICSGDIGIKNHRQVDIEAWFPAQGAYRELSSSSNCTDYQTRNLKIKTYSKDSDSPVLAHSLNCTGVVNRALFAIMEQFQNSDGTVTIPEVLREKFGSDVLD